MATNEFIQRFSETDWKASGITPEVFWRDLFEIFSTASTFGIAYQREAQIFQRLGIQDHLDLVDEILTELHTTYTAERLHWPAREISQYRTYAGLAPHST